jgi:hypothetical protein
LHPSLISWSYEKPLILRYYLVDEKDIQILIGETAKS